MNLDFSLPSPPLITVSPYFREKRPSFLFPLGTVYTGTVWGNELCDYVQRFRSLSDGATAEICRERRSGLLLPLLPRSPEPTWETAGEAHKGSGERTDWRIVPKSWENKTRKRLRAGHSGPAIFVGGAGWGPPSSVTVCGSWHETLISLETWMCVIFCITGTFFSTLSVKIWKHFKL